MMTLNRTELKASIVLKAMVTGLLKSKDDPAFTVDMGSFGKVEQEICYGCCATLALAEIFGKGRLASEMMIDYAKAQVKGSDSTEVSFSDVNLPEVLRSEALKTQDSWGIDLELDLENLERVIDYARRGIVSLLIHFLAREFNESFNNRWDLKDGDWRSQIPIVEATIAEMILAGY